MKKLLFFLLIIGLFSGCRTFRQPVFDSLDEDISGFQTLELQLNIPNLKNRVSPRDVFIKDDIIFAQVPEDPFGVFDSLPTIDISPQRLYEIANAFRVYSQHVAGNFEGGKVDKMVLEILKYEEGSSLELKLLTAFTMGIPCLVGMPANSVSTEINIQITLLDKNGLPLESFTASGFNRTYVAMYYGFGKDARTRSNVLAFEEAINNFILK